MAVFYDREIIKPGEKLTSPELLKAGVASVISSRPALNIRVKAVSMTKVKIS